MQRGMGQPGSSNFNTTIAEMGAYDFWASPYGIGLDREDADAINAKTATPAQLERAGVAVRRAQESLVLLAVGVARPT